MRSATVSYDQCTRALYIQLSGADIAETMELSHDVYLDVDAEARPVGIEVLNANPESAESLSGTTDAVDLIDVLRSSAG